MSRYVDADALIAKLKKYNPQTSKVKIAQIVVNNLPSIDIVRCKECAHWDKAINENGIEHFNFSKCIKGHYGNGLEFYCADGERRPNEI